MKEETFNPKCNHCGYQYTDEETWYGGNDVDTQDGGQSDLECPNCAQKFHSLCAHLVRFYAVDEDGEEI